MSYPFLNAENPSIPLMEPQKQNPDSLFHLLSMSDPGTTYRTREEIQRMRSTQDAINGLKKYLLDWEILDEPKLKAIDKAAKAEIDEAVVLAKESPMPDVKDFWTDIYVSAPLLARWS